MKLNEKHYKFVILFMIILICGVVYLKWNKDEEAPDSTILLSSLNEKGEETVDSKETIEGIIYIHICGEVKKPGVYQFDKEPRLVEVIKKAGGFTKNAATESINQAQTVSDGMQITIMNKKKVKKGKKDSTNISDENNSDNQGVNLNTATEQELMTLTGIGQAKAVEIIRYRQENGSFKTKEDIMNISGIKEGVFNKIKDFITV